MTLLLSPTRCCGFLAFIWCLSCCGAAVPDRPVGWVYYESGGTIARTSFSVAVVLKDNGVYEGLFLTSTGGIGSTGPASVSNPEDGTWSYRKIDDSTAELVIRTFSGSGPVSGVRTLRFSSDSTGMALRDDFGTGGSSGGTFRLAPQASERPLVNCSNRAFIRNGGSAFTGFVIADSTSRAVLIRAVGPGLAPFGITDVLKAPQLSVRSAKDNRLVGGSLGWMENFGRSGDGSAAIRRTGALMGAFALVEGSKDAATILNLSAGGYIAEVTSADPADSGQVLIEVYLLP